MQVCRNISKSDLGIYTFNNNTLSSHCPPETSRQAFNMADADSLQGVHDTLVALAFDAGKMILAADPSAIATDTKLNCRYSLFRLSHSLSLSLFPRSPFQAKKKHAR